ncbi:MAG TPA: helix-turn-helix transcriptional regulator [Mucilaginibacter sp.]|nr:helix-turn-helix transcriptional regulator [Mucilaginibacter sp.]HVW15334.1 helix-turn-helix transcriptional regulator [Mucilaginibacter sp.]
MAKTPLNSSVGTNIRRLRENNSWNQQSIAEKLNISIPAYSKIETGVTDVNLSRLAQIAHLFDTNLGSLFTDDEPRNVPIVSTEYTRLEKDLLDAEKEIVHLQRKVIQLYEEIHKNG